jgi:hypothetical protein
MAQLWILAANVDPLTAVATGADTSVCGTCPLRLPVTKGTGRVQCYVEIGRAPRMTWRS